MSQSITVYGSMYEFNYIEISDDTLQRLLAAKESEDDFWEGLEDIHDEIMGDSRLNGFAYKDGDPKLQVFVGSDEIHVGCESTESEESEKPVVLKAHYLVFEQWSKNGSMELEIEDEFDPDELSIDLDSDTLPNGHVRKVLDVSYDGESFEFQNSRPAYQDLYVLKMDGTVIQL